MGLGDAKLMAGIGLLFGWQSIPFVLFVSSILGLIFVMCHL
jgi:leader peptidase (prepilin peptidase)/N-methyltransferase